MQISRTVIRWAAIFILASIVLPIIVAVCGEFFIELGKEWGWYERPSERLGAAVTALSSFITQPWFLVIAALSGGLTAGLWADVWLRRREAAAAFPVISRDNLISLGEPGMLDHLVEGIQALKDITNTHNALSKQTLKINRATVIYNVRLQVTQNFEKRRKLAAGLASKMNGYSRRVGLCGPQIADARKRIRVNCGAAIESITVLDHDTLNELRGFGAVLESNSRHSVTLVSTMEQVQTTMLGIKGITRELNGAADFLRSTIEGICTEIRTYGEICNELRDLVHAKSAQAEVMLAGQSGFSSHQLLPSTPAGTPQ